MRKNNFWKNGKNRFIFKTIPLIFLTLFTVILVSKIQELSNISRCLSLVPPLIAILLSWLWREAIISLFMGVWIGAWINHGLSFPGIFRGLIDTFDIHILNSFNNKDHASIILFTLMIGGMIGIIEKNGGIMGMVNMISPWINSAKRLQLSAFALGIFIFFDDYVNTLFLGSSMKSISDRQGVSPEKLAYIIDSTAAPVACVALISTWIGHQLNQIGNSIAKIDGLNESAYIIFLKSIPYSFYPFLAIFFVFCVAWTQRDFGPMFKAERKMFKAEDKRKKKHQIYNKEFVVGGINDEKVNDLNPDPEILSWRAATNAILPLIALLGTTLIGLYITGSVNAGAGAELRQIIGQADPYKALIWGAGIGVFVSFLLTVIQKIMSLQDVLEAWLTGVQFIIKPVTLLLLAWALADVMEALNTSEFVSSILRDSIMPQFFPTLVFVISAFIAFASGTSWGTMAILLPIVTPLIWSVIQSPDLSSLHIFYASISSVLAGAVWGDHCSPISDTTILSATVSGCDHMKHVDTQLPYAFLVGVVAILFGTIPVGFGIPWQVCLIMGGLVLFIVLLCFGNNPRLD